MGHATLNSTSRPLTAFGFSTAAGFGMDFVVSKHVSLRPVQVDYMTSPLAPHLQNHLRVSAGVVLRWPFVSRRDVLSKDSSRPPAGVPRKASDSFQNCIGIGGLFSGPPCFSNAELEQADRCGLPMPQGAKRTMLITRESPCGT
jgi:hypothetical protein